MSDQWGTREQPSERDPGRLRAEHAFLLVAAISLTGAVAAYALDSTLPIDLNRGAYAIMVAFFVAGYCGWLSRSAERRGRRERRELAARLDALTAAVGDLRQQVTRQQVTYPPSVPRQRDGGRQYLSAAVSGQGDTVPITPPVDPESAAAARRISMRLLQGGDLH